MTNTLPPGPTEAPLRQVFRFGRDPLGFLSECAAKYGEPFTMRWPWDPPRVVVSDPAAVKAIFALRPDGYRSDDQSLPLNIGPASVLFQDGERHRRQRRLLTPPLHGETLRSYADTMRAITAAAVDGWSDGERVEAHSAMRDISLDVLLACVFGLHGELKNHPMRRKVVQWVDESLKPRALVAWALLSANRVRAFMDREVELARRRRNTGWLGHALPWRRLAGLKAELLAVLERDVRSCRNHGADGREDVLALLAGARYDDGGLMPEHEILDQLVTMLVGGHETTANTLSWVCHHLVEHPQVADEVRAEIQRVFGGEPLDPSRAGELVYLDAVIKESMRLMPIAPAVARSLTSELEVDGYTIPAGTIVFPSVYLTHRRADIWDQPLEFRPERFLTNGAPPPNHFFPFGGGARRCLGATFATFEMRIVVAEILSRVRLRKVHDARTDPVIRGFTVAPSDGAPVVIERL